jgi:hypothetical protein
VNRDALLDKISKTMPKMIEAIEGDKRVIECIQQMRREATKSKLCVHRFIVSPPFHSPQLHILIPWEIHQQGDQS